MARNNHGRDIWKQMQKDPKLRRALEDLQRLRSRSSRRNTANSSRTVIDSTAQVQPAAPLPQLYGSTGGKTALGIVKIVLGSLFGSVSFLGSIAGLILVFTGDGLLPFLLTLGLLGGSAGLVFSGVRTLNLLSRFKRYCRCLGNKTHCALEQLARAVGKPESFVRKDLKKLMNQGLFLEGHMDQEEATLITSHETYRHFEQSRLAYEQRKQLEAQEKAAAAQAAAQKAAQESGRDPKVKALLKQGEAYLLEIRRCNDAIPGQEISEKISRMELILRKIFHRLEMDPEVADDLKKMMDYYLPMTVKLLRAYADMDAQPIEGETIAGSKQEIADTLDTLNLAFEKLLDSIFQETAMDVSSDISVLQTLLAQEGLTEDPLAQIKKETNSR